MGKPPQISPKVWLVTKIPKGTPPKKDKIVAHKAEIESPLSESLPHNISIDENKAKNTKKTEPNIASTCKIKITGKTFPLNLIK